MDLVYFNPVLREPRRAIGTFSGTSFEPEFYREINPAAPTAEFLSDPSYSQIRFLVTVFQRNGSWIEQGHGVFSILRPETIVSDCSWKVRVITSAKITTDRINEGALQDTLGGEHHYVWAIVCPVRCEWNSKQINNPVYLMVAKVVRRAPMIGISCKTHLWKLVFDIFYPSQDDFLDIAGGFADCRLDGS